jgi:hypothetical protein
MIQGNTTWSQALAQLQKQPLYQLYLPEFGMLLASYSPVATGVTGYSLGAWPTVSDYYAGDFQSDMKATLNWLLSRRASVAGAWQANANPTEYPASASAGAPLIATTPALAECGILSANDLSEAPFTQTLIENLVVLPPSGQAFDTTVGPDGFPVNYSPVSLPTGTLFCPPFVVTSGQITAAYNAAVAQYPNGVKLCDGNTYNVLNGMTVYGSLLNLFATPGLSNIQDYRVDVFSVTDQYYYQSSAPGTSTPQTGPCAGVAPLPSVLQSQLVSQGLNGYWAAQVIGPGLVVAALYPSSVPQPAPGSYSPSLPAGWICHSNTGVGSRLDGYFARIYSETDVEYPQEDNIPIIVQDDYHARVGSNVVPAPGELTVHIIQQGSTDVLVYTSLAAESAFANLPLSFVVPTSDPLYVPDPTVTNVAGLQYRSYIYDCALGIITYASSGNFIAAAAIISELNGILANPGFLATAVLENAEDGSTARWSTSGGTIANVPANSMTPEEPPYGTGQVLKFSSGTSSATFSFTGSGLPDHTDPIISFEHWEPLNGGFSVINIGVTTASGKVTDIQVNSNAPGSPTYNSSAGQIQVPIGTGTGSWRVTEVNIAKLVSTLASDTLSGINSFTVTLPGNTSIYFDNLQVGGLQPANSLSFSYDTYYGQVDQAYIRTGAMAWVCYTYAVYMSLSLDYTPAPQLQAMLNFLLTLQSTASDSTNGFFYLGYGAYKDPGYQFVPGLQATVSTEHQVDTYFALMRGANVLPAAAANLLATGNLTQAQATAMETLATTISGLANTLGTKILNGLYIAPAGSVPGHFAQGVTGNAIDPSEALDASGYLTAILAHTLGRDDIALQCVEFLYQNFLLTNQTIQLSNASTSWNEAYRQLTPFQGFKNYNDSPGGYSGSPSSVWQEGTWSVILALVSLYSINGLAGYFQGLGTSVDSVLSALISSQQTIRGTTGDGSLLAYSLAARDLPWEFEVWPAFAAASFMWLVSLYPYLLFGAETVPLTLLDSMQIPQGSSQTPNELEGSSSIGTMTVKCVDSTGALKQLAAQDTLIGRSAQLQQGFPGFPVSEFVTLHTLQITQVGWDSNGMVTITCQDVQRFIQGQQVFWSGGPLEWSPGQTAQQPVGPAAAANGFPVSQNNPRYLQGNPIDLLLAVLQNELGVGQDPSLLGSNYVLNQLQPVYSAQQNYDPPPIPSGWVLFAPGNDSTLINPNLYIDVPQFLELRDSQFSGDWFEFQITRPVEGKQFIEEQILKPLGCYLIVGSDGQLRIKPMKPQPYQSPAFNFSVDNVIGIPQTERQSIVNLLTAKLDVSNTGGTTAARLYNGQVTYEQETSLCRYRQVYQQNIESTGVRVNFGGMCRTRMLADRVFRRHAFAPPAYRVKAHLASLPVELGDLVSLTHPLLLDFTSGKLGVVNIACEVIDRKPNHTAGSMEFLLLDTRFLNLAEPYQIAPLAAGIPAWGSATEAEKEQYMFISLAASGGEYADGTAGNTIY